MVHNEPAKLQKPVDISKFIYPQYSKITVDKFIWIVPALSYVCKMGNKKTHIILCQAI